MRNPIHEISEEEGNVKYTGKWGYKQYLKTKHWKATRGYMLKKHDNKCELCGSDKDLNIHHLSYERMGEEEEEDLMCLCSNCHSALHEYDEFEYLTSREDVIKLYSEYKFIRDNFTNAGFLYCFPLYLKSTWNNKQLSEAWSVTELQAKKKIREYVNLGLVVMKGPKRGNNQSYLLRPKIFHWLMRDFPKISKG